MKTFTELKRRPKLSAAVSAIADDIVKELFRDINPDNLLGSLTVSEPDTHLQNVARLYFKDYPLIIDNVIVPVDPEVIKERLSTVVSKYIWGSTTVVKQVLRDVLDTPTNTANEQQMGILEVLLIPTKFKGSAFDDIVNSFEINLKAPPTSVTRQWAEEILNSQEEEE